MPVPLAVVDAFTDRPFSGNPAGVCLLDGPATDAWMSAVAAEINRSETAFVHPLGDEWGLRWFTPAAEVPLCGHATLATAHLLVETGRVDEADAITFATASGRLVARIDAGLVTLDLPAYERSEVDGPTRAAVQDAMVGRVIDVAAYGPKLLAAVADPDAVRSGVTSVAAVANLPGEGLVVTASTATGYVLRYWAPSVGVDEDPVTGSAQCAAAPYWHEATGADRFEVRQLSPRGGTLTTSIEPEDRVAVAGGAVTVWRADLLAEPT